MAKLVETTTTKGHDSEGRRTETERKEYSDGSYKQTTQTDVSESSILSRWNVTETKTGKR